MHVPFIFLRSIGKQAIGRLCLLLCLFLFRGAFCGPALATTRAAQSIDREKAPVADNRLIEAVEANRIKKIILLIRNGYNVNDRDFLGYSPLHYAAKMGNGTAASLLIQANALLDQTSFKNGHTPLALAIVAGHKGIAKLLLGAGANPEVVHKDGRNALHLAIQYRRTAIVDLLLRSGCSCNAPTKKEGMSPLLLAIRAKNRSIVRRLLEQRELRSSQDNRGYTELHWAAKQNQPTVFKWLVVSRKWDLDAQAHNGVTVLHLLAANPQSHPSLLHCLKNVPLLNAHARDATGSTPLHYAASKNQLKMVDFLLNDFCANPDVQNHLGQTALHYAVQNGHVAVVKKLLTCAKASITLKNKEDVTPLALAVRSKNPAMAKLFGKYKNFVAVQ